MEKRINLFSGLRLRDGLFFGCFMGLIPGIIAGIFFLVFSLGITMVIISEAVLDFGLLRFLFGILLFGGYFLILGLLQGFALGPGKLVFTLSFGLSYALSFALGFVLANIIPACILCILGFILYSLYSLFL